MVLTEKWPVFGRHGQAARWLQVWSDLGRAPRTIDAYARGLSEYLLMLIDLLRRYRHLITDQATALRTAPASRNPKAQRERQPPAG